VSLWAQVCPAHTAMQPSEAKLTTPQVRRTPSTSRLTRQPSMLWVATRGVARRITLSPQVRCALQMQM
jgi:hypothetical protein